MELFCRNIAPFFLLVMVVLFPFVNNSQSVSNRFLFKENKGQFTDVVLFKANISNGNMFLTRKGFTYSFFDKSSLDYTNSEKDNKSVVKCHSIEVEFEKSNRDFNLTKSRKSFHYLNYYKGNDSSKWINGVRAYNEVTYNNIYNGISFKIYEYNESIKYDFIVKPKADVSDIRIRYKGQDELLIRDGALVIINTIQEVVEQRPYAYQVINGEKKEVKCEFIVDKDIVSFHLSEGYNSTHELIIDPVIVFSSYVNSTSDNFGFAATYDTSGASYVSGIVFGSGYPTSIGAYDVTWAGGSTFPFYSDIAISKFTSKGDSLLYSTYIGGADGEVPHSMVSNNQGELFIYGTTGSSNFPVYGTSYDNSFAGGTAVTPNSKSTTYSNGCDIFVVKFNSAGTSLLGSTFVGGSGNDGINVALGLAYNHGDEYRGDIVLDASGNPSVVSTTNSINFPVVNGLPNRGGGSDVVVFKLNSSLTSLLWSTYYGGNGNDAGYGIAHDLLGNTFITGGTSSSSIGTTINSNFGGIDGFLAKYNNAGVLQAARYIGTSSYDQSYFVDVDVNDDVYIFGQTLGAMPIFSSGPVYSNAGSHQFLKKFNNSLSTLEIATIVGKNGTTIDFSPTAFKVSDCGMIYICGWGGVMNTRAGGSTNGLPVFMPYQGGSTGSDFYIMLLEKDAKSLFNATFFGGASGAEHVDGGNSKFDNEGTIYQAVCAGCSAGNDYPTTVGSWSDTSGYSNNCNAAIFKFKIDTIHSAPTIPSITICFPNLANFGNQSIGSNAYLWNFGDSNTSTSITPSHLYSSPGRYTVSLVAYDSNGCLEPDTNDLVVHVLGPPVIVTSSNRTRCPNQATPLFASGASTYVWSPAATLNNSTVSNPIASTPVTTTYMVIGTDLCGADTGFVTITINTIPPVLTTSPDTTICPGDSTQLYAIGASSYVWFPSASLSNAGIYNPKAAPTNSTNYTVIGSNACGKDTAFINVITKPISFGMTPDTAICLGDSLILRAPSGTNHIWTPQINIMNDSSANPTVFPTTSMSYYLNALTLGGCRGIDTVDITVIQVPVPTLSGDTSSCPHQAIMLTASGATNYVWQPPYKLSSTFGSAVTTRTDTTITYFVDFSNVCFNKRDSVKINVVNIKAISAPDDTICASDTAVLWAYGGDTYSWFPVANVAQPFNSITKAKSDLPTDFYVIVENTEGCKDTAYTKIFFHPKSFLNAGANQVLVYGSSTFLDATHSYGQFFWNSHYSLDCDTCPDSFIKPELATDYIANLIDTFGCRISDTVSILMDGSIYVPNSFTPNRDFKNETFVVSAKDLIEFKIEIFNRWGELIYESMDIDNSWDGTYKGKEVATGTYVWKLTYMDARLLRTTKYGHINLLR